ncbi:5-formyltetrahydrofolate cyclo-ligase [soil metagenome]|nr:5-formyltetrahydrofolate cyclo-ligase [Euzebyaceae bacterium]
MADNPTKATLRASLLTVRGAIPGPQRAAAAAEIRRRVGELPELADARAVLAYAAFGAEVDLDPWLQRLLDAGVGVFLPWVDGPSLGIARVRDLAADLAPGWRGVREPRAGRRRPARPDRLEAVVTPGVAFDRTGHRLGYGGGHFDRLLAELRPGVPVVGVAFERQLVDAVPTEPHDRRVDVVVTEEAVYRAGGGAGGNDPGSRHT